MEAGRSGGWRSATEKEKGDESPEPEVDAAEETTLGPEEYPRRLEQFVDDPRNEENRGGTETQSPRGEGGHKGHEGEVEPPTEGICS